MDIRTVQEQLCYKDMGTTEIYTHVLQRGGNAVISPLGDILGLRRVTTTHTDGNAPGAPPTDA